MKTMKIEKKLLFDDKVSSVHQVSAEEKLQYQSEADGSIRAMGPLFIKGEMINEAGVLQPFQEVLDMDVLAPAYKLGDQPFQLQVKDVQYEVEDDGIALVIHMSIHGLKEDQEKVVTPMPQTLPQQFSQSVSQPVSTPLSSSSVKDDSVETAETPDDESAAVEVTGNVVDDFEDLFEDADTTYTSYRMVVAQNQDTYGSIALRYDVEEEALRAVNRNKDVQPKTLIVLPF